MPDPVSNPPRSIARIVGELHVEIGILIFCAAIISETGKTQGPVFDTVGPDLLPTAVAVIVAALTLVQVVVQIATRDSTDHAGSRIDRAGVINGLVFCLATILYVAVLAWQIVPFYLATCGFMAVTTALLSQGALARNALLGAGIGLGLGLFLQFIFTQVLVIDLPG